VLRTVAHQQLTAPIDLARPVERLPAAWLAELRQGPIDDVRIEGLPTLHAGLTVEDQAVGDVSAVEGAEAHLFRLPPLRPALVVVAPAAPVGVFAADGTVLREGQGRVAVLAGDPADAFVAVAFDGAADHATTVRVRLDPGRADGAVGDTHGAVAAAAQASWIAEPAAPSAADAVPAAQPARPAPAQPAPAQPAHGVTAHASASASANAAGVTARGTIVDVATGQALDGAAFVVDPDVDANALLARFLAGRMTERQFRARVADWVLTGADGRFAFAGLRRGASYTIGAYAAGYRPVFRAVTPTRDAPATWELPVVGLARAR
jgi:hypothetical protein